jgi:hypothetical protein
MECVLFSQVSRRSIEIETKVIDVDTDINDSKHYLLYFSVCQSIIAEQKNKYHLGILTSNKSVTIDLLQR